MARGRMVNKTITVSLKINQLSSDTCRLMATWIISHLDKHGVYHGHPGVVRSYMFPRRTDVTVEDVDGYLDEMEAVGLIVRFTARGDQWLWWPGFARNQVGLRADRETTVFPPPPAPDVPASDGDGDAQVPSKGGREEDGAEAPAQPAAAETEEPGAPGVDGRSTGPEGSGEARAGADLCRTVSGNAPVGADPCRTVSGSVPDADRHASGSVPAEEKLKGREVKRSERKRSPSRPRARAPDSEDGDREDCPNAFSLYQQAGGVLSQILADQLGDLVDKCEAHRQSLPPPAAGADRSGDEWVQAAIHEAVGAGARISVNYVKAILDRWRRDGFSAPFNGRKRGDDGTGYQHRAGDPDSGAARASADHNRPDEDEILRRRLILARHDLQAGKESSPYYQYLPENERPPAPPGL